MAATIGDNTMRSALPLDGRAVAGRTPGLLLGPYYPLEPSADASTDLCDRDVPLPTDARYLRLQGTVVNLQGRPVTGAWVEIWHADHQGRYRHPSAPRREQVAAGFTGYGRTRSDARGHFSFRRVVPGAYAAGDVRRAPHVHLQVTGQIDRLVTQMFLPGHPLNQGDHWYRTVSRPELLTPQVVRDDPGNALVLAWTVALAQG